MCPNNSIDNILKKVITLLSGPRLEGFPKYRETKNVAKYKLKHWHYVHKIFVVVGI